MVFRRRTTPFRRRLKRTRRPVLRRRRALFSRRPRLSNISRQLLRGDAIRIREVQTDEDLKFLATTGTPTLHAFQLTQSSADVKDLVSVYQWYRCRYVVVKHIPRWDNATLVQQGTASGGTQSPIVTNAMWKTCVWHLPTPPATGTEMLQQRRNHFKRITHGAVVKYKPNNFQGIALPGGSAQWNESTPVYDKWIESSDITAPYYGIAYDLPVAVQSGFTGTPVLFTRVFYKYWEFKRRR